MIRLQNTISAAEWIFFGRLILDIEVKAYASMVKRGLTSIDCPVDENCGYRRGFYSDQSNFH